MLKIKGGNLLKGSIEVKGSKNAALALIVCSIFHFHLEDHHVELICLSNANSFLETPLRSVLSPF